MLPSSVTGILYDPMDAHVFDATHSISEWKFLVELCCQINDCLDDAIAHLSLRVIR